jgi:hypothetical protein
MDGRDKVKRACVADGINLQKSLTYGCVCSNGLQPNISQYTLTLPYFTCTEWGTQCVKRCGQNNECSRECREGNPCGALDPPKPNVTSTTTTGSATGTAAATSTGPIVFNGLGGEASSTSTPPRNGAASLSVGNWLGFIPVAAGLAAGFAMVF